MNSNTLNEIIEGLGAGNCPECNLCDATDKNPWPVRVPLDWAERPSEERLLLVGTTADLSRETRLALEELNLGDGFSVAQTSLVRCTSVEWSPERPDGISELMRDSCVRELNLAGHEIRGLQPGRLLVLAHAAWDGELPWLARPLGTTFDWLEDKDHRLRCSSRKVARRAFRLGEIEGLRLAPPRRLRRKPWAQLIRDWLEGSVTAPTS